MCGITGIWGQTNPILVKSMMDSIAHRGPDAEGMYAPANQSGNLGHRRLSIMDPHWWRSTNLWGSPNSCNYRQRRNL